MADVEITELRREVAELRSLALTPQQRAVVERLAQHVESIVSMVEEDRVWKRAIERMRSWIVAVAAVIAAAWVIRDGAARALRSLLDP